MGMAVTWDTKSRRKISLSLCRCSSPIHNSVVLAYEPHTSSNMQVWLTYKDLQMTCYNINAVFNSHYAVLFRDNDEGYVSSVPGASVQHRLNPVHMQGRLAPRPGSRRSCPAFLCLSFQKFQGGLSHTGAALIGVARCTVRRCGVLGYPFLSKEGVCGAKEKNSWYFPHQPR